MTFRLFCENEAKGHFSYTVRLELRTIPLGAKASFCRSSLARPLAIHSEYPPDIYQKPNQYRSLIYCAVNCYLYININPTAMKTIIVATDYSSFAQKALNYGARLAKDTGSKLVLFNAFFLPVPTLEAMAALPDIHERISENKAKLSKIAGETTATYDMPVETKIGMGPLLEELEELTKQYEEPLVVVGMRGNSLERKIFGSVTTSVIRNGDFPVLAVPAEAEYRDISKIVFACDYNSLSDFNQLAPLKELAYKFKAHLQVLHIEKKPALAVAGPAAGSKRSDELEKVFSGIDHSFKDLENEDIIDGIEKGVKEFDADLLVMVPHKAGFWDNILKRSNTRKMVLRTPIPLLALPDRHE